MPFFIPSQHSPSFRKGLYPSESQVPFKCVRSTLTAQGFKENELLLNILDTWISYRSWSLPIWAELVQYQLNLLTQIRIWGKANLKDSWLFNRHWGPKAAQDQLGFWPRNILLSETQKREKIIMMGTIKNKRKKRSSHSTWGFLFRQIQLVNLCTELCKMKSAKGQRKWWNLPHCTCSIWSQTFNFIWGVATDLFIHP